MFLAPEYTTIIFTVGYCIISVALFLKVTERYFFYFFILALLVLFLHGGNLVLPWFISETLSFGFSTAFSWTLWLASMFILIETYFGNKFPLVSIFVFPTAAIAGVITLVFPPPNLITELSLLFRAHILVAMLSYCSFVLSLIQAITLLIQETSLRTLSSRSPSFGLPSLLELDFSLYRVILVTFFLLSATLISGVHINSEVGNNLVTFDHKTLFSFLAWLLVLIILGGRYRLGWRGRFVARLTIIGFLFVLLAYIGTQFVIEVILN
ncbi:MAG: hypothetical protein CBC42_03385 [Betaproteobacteria bacterium TMED82]|nr:MAG: hypothetical protein CBC42_03385 [Betaproteobacteria bacterium TMED82]|tara:strand:+ start:68738 stop:69538 length:801 start_codon:yes stop_codon:yes gene_type:complete